MFIHIFQTLALNNCSTCQVSTDIPRFTRLWTKRYLSYASWNQNTSQQTNEIQVNTPQNLHLPNSLYQKYLFIHALAKRTRLPLTWIKFEQDWIINASCLISLILQNQTFCGKGNADTKRMKFEVSTSHDPSEISIQQFSFSGNSCLSWLDLRVELPVWYSANILKRGWLLLQLVRCPSHIYKAETN